MQVVVEDDTYGEALVRLTYIRFCSVTFNYTQLYAITLNSIQLHAVPSSSVQYTQLTTQLALVN